MPAGTIYVGRGTRWGNPFKVDANTTNAQAVLSFKIHMDLSLDGFMARSDASKKRLVEFLAPLRGKDLACWCKLGDACHADVLLELANSDIVKE